MSSKTETYLMNFFSHLGSLFTSIKGWILMVLAVFLATRTGHLILFLIVVFHLDLITGILASYIKYKREKIKHEVYFLESEKFRMSIIKGGFYIWFTVGCYVIQQIFKIDDINVFGREFTLCELSLMVCIGIELYSNIENFKKMGFDLFGKIKTMAKGIWGLINAVKNKPNE